MDTNDILVRVEVLRLVAELEDAIKRHDLGKLRYATNLLKAHLTSNKQFLTKEMIEKVGKKINEAWGRI